jgi:hypothetical protein
MINQMSTEKVSSCDIPTHDESISLFCNKWCDSDSELVRIVQERLMDRNIILENDDH